MTALVVRARQANAEGFLEVGALATVRLLADLDGHAATEWWETEVPIPVAGRDVPDGVSVPLPQAGYYRVGIALPRSPDVARQVRVTADEELLVSIDLAVSPHEYLAWQQFSGAIRDRPYAPEAGLADSVTASGRLGRMLTSAREQVSGLQDAVSYPPTVSVAAVASGMDGWLQVARVGAPGEPLYLGAPPDEWPGPSWDHEFVAWSHTPSRDEGAELVTGLTQRAMPYALEAKFPRWLAFRSAEAVDLVSVPWAWWGRIRQDDEAIQFFYDRVHPSPIQPDVPGRLRLTVRDRRWFGLLEYLAVGRLDLASRLVAPALEAEYPEDMTAAPESALYGKTKSPLVAAAGAFVLITDAPSSEPQYWDQWLDNLALWFPGIPDGLILLGCRRAEQALSQAEREEAFAQISDGMNRGIPFLAATMRLASVALARMADTVTGAEKAMRTISGVSTRVDPDQPFTVIRLR